jgi:uncharacterized protein (TIGR01777 family)
MKLLVTGATGFIGSALCSRLLERGHALTLLTCHAPPDASTPAKIWRHWMPGTSGDWGASLDGADGVINLAGEPIAARRWTESQKNKIRSSRIDATRSIVEGIAKAQRKPSFLLNASAVGYYGPHGDEILTEETPAGSDFLSSLCRAWEEEAQGAQSMGIRVVRLRTGIVLGPHGGALAKMVPPFKLFLGGPLGSGAQWMSWIHLEDEIGLILHLIENPQAVGPVNGTAPNSVTMKDFCQTLGKVMHRPSWLPVPGFAMRLMLGEMADILLTGQRAVPTAAKKLGYQFRYANLSDALKACMPLER